jgi:CBS domain-containing protein
VTVETILRQKGADVATIEPDASIKRAADWLRIKNIGALVVTSGKAVLAGIISIGDVVKHRLDDLESETNVLRDAYMATH